MELTKEDMLRLHVLLSKSDAIRIEESTMTVRGLGQEGEHAVKLSPFCSDDAYLRAVRELLSNQIIQSNQSTMHCKVRLITPLTNLKPYIHGLRIIWTHR